MPNTKQTVGELIYKITAESDGLKTELNKSETAVKTLGNEMEKSASKTEGFTATMKKLAAGLGLAYLAKIAFDFGKASVQAYANAQQSIIQYNNAQENVAGSTKEQINDLNDYIQALENKTTVDDKSIRQASQILAQDQVKIENQKKLLAGIVDIAVANSKSNGGEVDVSGTAVAVGRTLATGDVGALTRQNIVGIDDATQKAFKLGDEAKRTAILMQLLADNGKGAGEALANSAQGGMNRAKDKLEDIQKVVGKGLNIAFGTFIDNILTTDKASDGLVDKTNILGKSFVFIAGVAGLVANSLRLAFETMKAGFLIIGDGAALIGSFAFDVITNFQQVGKAVGSVGVALGHLMKGEFKEAKDAIGEGFDFKMSDRTKGTLQNLKDDANGIGEAYNTTNALILKNLDTITNASKVYDDHAKEVDKLEEAKDSLNKQTQKETQLTDEQKDALKKLEEASDQYKNKFLDVVASIKSAVSGLNDDLTKSFAKFNDDFGKDLKDGTTDLVKVFVDAEDKIKDLKKQLSQVTGSDPSDIKQRTDINAQIAEQQKVVDSRVDYEKRQAQVILDIKKKLADAGIDAEKSGLTALTTVTDLKDQIKKEEDLRALGDFAKQEEINKQKLLALTDQLIAEVTATQEKIAKQQELEAELTTFLKEHNKLRKADVDAFANSAIAKYGEMAKALQNTISLQQQLNNLTGNATGEQKKQFAKGGYVGSDGGEVHPGEYVIPANMVQQLGGFVSQLEDVRASGGNTTSINAPINIQANMSDRVDANSVAKEIAWQLGRM